LRLHVREYGVRAALTTPVVCLPGLARTVADFEVLAPALADDLGPGVEVRVLGPRDAGGAVVGPSPDLDPVLTVVLADGGVGRSEIVHAVDALARSGIAPDALDEPALARHLFDPGVPDPDLVVVTGGDRRIPDLLTWEMAYSELVFLDATWPLLEVHHFSAAVEEYRHRNRRYGGLEAPKRPGGRS